MSALLDIRNLSTTFSTESGVVHAVNEVSMSVEAGETIGIVGESGSGKTVSMLTVMGLLPGPPRTHVSGEILFQGKPLTGLSDREMRKIRGKEMTMIFQDPMTSLNPVLTVERQLTEPTMVHLGMSRKQARNRAVELLQMVDIPAPARRLSDYPHQFSGGMRQRLMIAMALACHPRLLIADEPTTSLDVTVQAGIVELVKRLSSELQMAVIWVTHDLSLLANLANRVAVMYAGRIVETAPVDDLYYHARHPYSIGLLRSIPSEATGRTRRLNSIEGLQPSLINYPTGCPFHARCAFAIPECVTNRPDLESIAPAHGVACWVRPDLADVPVVVSAQVVSDGQ